MIYDYNSSPAYYATRESFIHEAGQLLEEIGMNRSEVSVDFDKEQRELPK